MSKNIDAVYQTFPIERFALPTEEQVAALESRLKVKLPQHFRDFMLLYNGGGFAEPYPFMAPPQKECPVDRLTALWGIGASYRFAELGHDVDLFDDNDPPIVLPIGGTQMNNLLYLVTADAEDRGSVCLKLAGNWTSFVLADTMDEFFGLLRRSKPTR
jgi:hypothetical protein